MDLFFFNFLIKGKTSDAFYLRRTKTLSKEDTKKIQLFKKVTTDSVQFDLQKNIELVYGQISPDKINSKMNLNSPSERSRLTFSIKRKNISVDSVDQTNVFNIDDSHEEKKDVTMDFKPHKSKKTENEEYNEILKINTPKYTVFTHNHSIRLLKNPNCPRSDIYKNNKLINVLKEQSNAEKGKNNNKKIMKNENSKKIEENDTSYSKFKVRILSRFNINQAGNGHRKIKSNA